MVVTTLYQIGLRPYAVIFRPLDVKGRRMIAYGTIRPLSQQQADHIYRNAREISLCGAAE